MSPLPPPLLYIGISLVRLHASILSRDVLKVLLVSIVNQKFYYGP